MIKGFRPFLLSFLVFFMILGPLFAASDDITVKADVDKAFLTIGDPVTYTVTVEHAPDIQILSRIPPPDSDVLEVKKTEEIDRKEGKKLVTGRQFTLTTYRLGEFVLDPVIIKYKKEGQAEKALQTNKIYLTVKSVAEGETKEDIRDVKSVVPLGAHFGWILILLGVLILATVAFFVVRALRKKGLQGLVPESSLTPEEEALQNLHRLFESDILKRGFVKLYYLELSEILRVYFEKRYGILAVESTTFEIMRALKDQDLPKGLGDKIHYVLSSADLAKFAKWVPSPEEIAGINKKSEEIVRETAPVDIFPEKEAPHAV